MSSTGNRTYNGETFAQLISKGHAATDPYVKRAYGYRAWLVSTSAVQRSFAAVLTND